MDLHSDPLTQQDGRGSGEVGCGTRFDTGEAWCTCCGCAENQAMLVLAVGGASLA